MTRVVENLRVPFFNLVCLVSFDVGAAQILKPGNSFSGYSAAQS